MSYSAEIKKYLSEQKIKKKCCRDSYSKGLTFLADPISEFDFDSCDTCLNALLRGIFISCGHITDPAKQYHLEFVLDSPERARVLFSLISAFGIHANEYQRKGKYVVYIKASDSISELLAAIGANTAAFDIINNRILTGMTSDVTRAVNFDTANIKRLSSAYERDIEAIRYLSEHDKLDKLPPHLYETAILRQKYDYMSLAELGSHHSVSISKSGVKHRLAAITKIYNDIIAELAETKQNNS